MKLSLGRRLISFSSIYVRRLLLHRHLLSVVDMALSPPATPGWRLGLSRDADRCFDLLASRPTPTPPKLAKPVAQ